MQCELWHDVVGEEAFLKMVWLWEENVGGQKSSYSV